MHSQNPPSPTDSPATGLAAAILEVGRKAHSEEDVRMGVERALAGTLQALGLAGTPEYEKTTFSGSADAVYGHVTIEYKRPGRLGEKGFPVKPAQQIARYLTDHARAEADPTRQAAALEKMIGIGLDAQQILFVRYASTGRRRELPLPTLPGSQLELVTLDGQAGGFQVVGPVPVTRESVDLLLLYLRSLSRGGLPSPFCRPSSFATFTSAMLRVLSTTWMLPKTTPCLCAVLTTSCNSPSSSSSPPPSTIRRLNSVSVEWSGAASSMANHMKYLADRLSLTYTSVCRSERS